MRYPGFFSHKDYRWINIIGLSIGIACIIAIMLWIEDELSFDSFNKNANLIYRVLVEENGMAGYTNSAMTMPPLERALKDKLPEIDKAAIFESDWTVVVKVGEDYFNEEGMAVAGKDFFDIFSFPFVNGNPQLLKTEKYSVALSEKIAKKYFGEDDAVGKSIEINKNIVKVIAVFKDIDYNSHISFDFVIPEDLFGEGTRWDNQCLYTYVQVMPNVSAEVLRSKLYDFITKNIDQENKTRLLPQPLKDIHFQKNLADEDYTNLGDIRYIYIFSLIGLLILVLACVNFVNLSTAVSEKKIKDNNLRKIFGASKAELVRTSVLKSLLNSTQATAIGLVILYLILPVFNSFTHKNLGIDLSNPFHILCIISIALTTGILSGLYPAFFLASFSPVKMIKSPKTRSGLWRRNGLIVFQFSLSIFLIIASLVSFKQFNHIRQINPGFDKENVIYFNLETEKPDYQTLKERILKIPGVEMVAGKEYYSPTILNTSAVNLPGEEIETTTFSVHEVDEDFLSLLKVKFTEGQNFSMDSKSEWNETVIINQKAKELIDGNPVGQILKFWGRQFRITGVLDEANFRSVNASIQPELYVYTDSPGFIFVRYNNTASNSINYLADQVKSTVKELYPEAPFDYKFMDATYAKLYENDKRVGTIYAILTTIAILISCIGLFGLSSFSSENRTKEIGIRKINGAKISEILIMLNTDYIILLTISYLIAIPLAWYAMHKWLQGFACKTELSLWIFVSAGIIALIIALLTVSWQSLRAATRNPVDALRYE